MAAERMGEKEVGENLHQAWKLVKEVIDKTNSDPDSPICSNCRNILRVAMYSIQAIIELAVNKNNDNFLVCGRAARKIIVKDVY